MSVFTSKTTNAPAVYNNMVNGKTKGIDRELHDCVDRILILFREG